MGKYTVRAQIEFSVDTPGGMGDAVTGVERRLSVIKSDGEGAVLVTDVHVHYEGLPQRLPRPRSDPGSDI